MKKKVLILDDEAMVRRMLRRFLERFDFEVFEAQTLADGLKLCIENEMNILFLDYNISNGETGWNLAQELADTPSVNTHPYTIAMSGTIQLNDDVAEKYTQALFDTFLEKPFEYATIKELLQKLS